MIAAGLVFSISSLENCHCLSYIYCVIVTQDHNLFVLGDLLSGLGVKYRRRQLISF